MFDEPDEPPAERPSDPLLAAKEKFDEFRIHAELAAVFEGTRKFDAEIIPTLGADLAREIQRTMAKLEKSKTPELPFLEEEVNDQAAALLDFPATKKLSTNDYHIHRRPGEVMIARWLHADEVDKFYERFQAHFDAALNQYREEERQQQGWKQDEATLKYLEALDNINVKMSDRYLRPLIRDIEKLSKGEVARVFILSTQTADEIDILYLADYLMSVPPEQIVGQTSAPPEDGPTEQDRAWFFKLFALRGLHEGVERMCFFAFMQKTDEEI
jgi:hypothetical protein